MYMNMYVHVGPYLIVATESKVVGTIDKSEIKEITKTDIIPFTKTTIHLSEPQVRACLQLESITRTRCVHVYVHDCMYVLHILF